MDDLELDEFSNWLGYEILLSLLYTEYFFLTRNLNLPLSYPKFGNGTDCLSFFDPADEKEIEVKVYSYNNTKDEYIRNIVYKNNVFTFWRT